MSISEPAPRTMGIATLILGFLAIVFAVVEAFFVGEPMHVSSPSPRLTEWLVGTFGMTGLRILVVLFFGLGGVFAVRYGLRALKSRSLN